MKAAVLRSFSAPPSIEDIPEPTATADTVRVRVHAAAVHPLVRGLASGRHYASPKQFPVTLGIDGVGELNNGERVYFGPLRPPFGAIAEWVVVPKNQVTPIPADLDVAQAAAIVNPGLAALLPLTWRGALAAGQRVCILGATGAAGQLAVRLAKLHGAGHIVAVGRQHDVLQGLRAVGATHTITLRPDADLVQAFTEAAGDGFDVMVDYLWGEPTQALLTSIARAKYAKEMRLVQVGEMAGPDIKVPGSVLRSTGLSISGFGLRATGMAPPEVESQGITTLMQQVHRGVLRVDTTEVPLHALSERWSQPGRLVVRCI